MTENELFKKFYKEFEADCYTLRCEGSDCCECHTFISAFEEYKTEVESESKKEI